MKESDNELNRLASRHPFILSGSASVILAAVFAVRFEPVVGLISAPFVFALFWFLFRPNGIGNNAANDPGGPLDVKRTALTIIVLLIGFGLGMAMILVVKTN